MTDYFYGQFDESLDSILCELSYYVTCVSNLNVKYSDLSEKQYTDTILEERLLKWPDDQVIVRLTNLLNTLKKISMTDIKNAIPDDTGWKSEIISNVNERTELFQGIKETLNFISGIINRREKLVTTDPPRLFSYKGDKTKLRSLERELVRARFIDQTVSFIDIFRGCAPNERINWIHNKSYFCYFIKLLFRKAFDTHANWEIARNSFTINGKTLPNNIDKNNGKLPLEITKVINSAIDSLIN